MTSDDDEEMDEDFMAIGTAFQISGYGSTIVGPVVASREALFCFLGRGPARAPDSSPLHMMANLAADAAYHVSGEKSKLEGMALPRIPKRIADHPNWPREIPTKGPVILLPRDRAEFISYSSVWSYRVYMADFTVYVTLNTFGRGECLSFLEENGWAPDHYASFASQVAPLIGVVVGAVGGWFVPVVLGGFDVMAPVCAASAAVGFILGTSVGMWVCHMGARRRALPTRV